MRYQTTLQPKKDSRQQRHTCTPPIPETKTSSRILRRRIPNRGIGRCIRVIAVWIEICNLAVALARVDRPRHSDPRKGRAIDGSTGCHLECTVDAF